MNYSDEALKLLYLKRIEINYSQREVAEYLGISQSTFSKLEKGNTILDINRYFHICTFLDIDPIQILHEVFSHDLNEDFKLESQSRKRSDSEDAKKDVKYFKMLIHEKDKYIDQLEKSIELLRTLVKKEL